MTRPDRRSPSLFFLGSWPKARRTEHVTVAVLCRFPCRRGSGLCGAADAQPHLPHRRTAEQASADENADDIPDVVQRRTRA